MKLTNTIREKIEINFLNGKGYRNRMEEATTAFGRLIKAEWEKTYPQGLLEFKLWLRTASSVTVFGDAGAVIEGGSLDSWYPFGYSHRPECIRLEVLPHAEQRIYHASESPHIRCTPEVLAALDLRAQRAKEWNEAGETVRAVLFSCSTDKQLLELMPELEPFVPKPEVQSSLIDAKAVEKLRAMMGS